jgi:hypothetical protein
MLIILYASYIMLSCSYTFESFLSEKLLTKYWYLFPLVFVLCIAGGWLYFPGDVGAKLYKKLN